jgi:hypothetical protein
MFCSGALVPLPVSSRSPNNREPAVPAVAGAGKRSISAEVWFFDTNVLAYLFDTDEPDKQARARELLQQGALIHLSTQVLQQFLVATTRKLSRPLAP